MMYIAASRRTQPALIGERASARKPKTGSARARLARHSAIRRTRPLRAKRRRRPEPVAEMVCRPWQSWWEHTTYQA